MAVKVGPRMVALGEVDFLLSQSGGVCGRTLTSAWPPGVALEIVVSTWILIPRRRPAWWAAQLKSTTCWVGSRSMLVRYSPAVARASAISSTRSSERVRRSAALVMAATRSRLAQMFNVVSLSPTTVVVTRARIEGAFRFARDSAVRW